MNHLGELVECGRHPKSLAGSDWGGWRDIFFIRVCDAAESRVRSFSLPVLPEGFVFFRVRISQHREKFAHFRGFRREKRHYCKREKENRGAGDQGDPETP